MLLKGRIKMTLYEAPYFLVNCGAQIGAVSRGDNFIFILKGFIVIFEQNTKIGGQHLAFLGPVTYAVVYCTVLGRQPFF